MIDISPYRSRPEGPADKDFTGLAAGDDLLRPSLWLDDAADLKVFSNARTAMWACLKNLQLSRNDEVCIVTTSNGPYISSCVTRTIETVCSWSRVVTRATRLVVVIHEFGFPCGESTMRELLDLGIPILEDGAYAVGSRLEGADIGRYGDFAIYSLPKFYPVGMGGLLVSRQSSKESLLAIDAAGPDGYLLSATDHVEVLRRLSFKPDAVRHWCEVRRDHWNRFVRRLAVLGVEPYFELDERSVPGVFVCKLPQRMNGALLKERFVNAGIEATEYYGHGGFYFPIHQFLSETEINLMLRLFEEIQ